MHSTSLILFSALKNTCKVHVLCIKCNKVGGRERGTEKGREEK